MCSLLLCGERSLLTRPSLLRSSGAAPVRLGSMLITSRGSTPTIRTLNDFVLHDILEFDFGETFGASRSDTSLEASFLPPPGSNTELPLKEHKNTKGSRFSCRTHVKVLDDCIRHVSSTQYRPPDGAPHRSRVCGGLPAEMSAPRWFLPMNSQTTVPRKIVATG